MRMTLQSILNDYTQVYVDDELGYIIPNDYEADKLSDKVLQLGIDYYLDVANYAPNLETIIAIPREEYVDISVYYKNEFKLKEGK